MSTHDGSNTSPTQPPRLVRNTHITGQAEPHTAPYNPWDDAEELGLHIRYAPLHDSWSWWVPSRHLVVVANHLTHAQERCTVAHQVEHARHGDNACRRATPVNRLWTRQRQEIRADKAAARKLIPAVDLQTALRWAESPEAAAHELHVTEHMLRVRLRAQRKELACLATSRTAG